MSVKEKTSSIFVREKNCECRKEIITFLEERGYFRAEHECRSKQEIIDGILPIVLDRQKREFSMMGNVTCAAAAVSSGCMITKEELYSLMNE